MIPGKIYTPGDFLRIAWRRKWIILVPFVIMSLGTYGVVKRLPNRYRSQTLILVVPQRVPDSYVRSTVTATIASAGGTSSTLDSGLHTPGVYRFDWTAPTPGRWTFTVTADDDLGRHSTAARPLVVGQ